MKLELQHLAAYLPYKLKCLVDGQVAEMNSVYSDGSCTFCDIVESEQGFANLYPILRPLSDLEDINNIFFCESNLDLITQKEINSFSNHWSSLHSLSYDAYSALCRNHVDLFCLIEKGLAVDIKTLPPHDS
jgi:hypothetical protein